MCFFGAIARAAEHVAEGLAASLAGAAASRFTGVRARYNNES